MHKLDRRVAHLESLRSRERRYERMTDGELDARIAVLHAEWLQQTGRAPKAEEKDAKP